MFLMEKLFANNACKGRKGLSDVVIVVYYNTNSNQPTARINQSTTTLDL